MEVPAHGGQLFLQKSVGSLQVIITMRYAMQWRPYRRQYSQPLVVAGYHWPWREGIIVRLERPDGFCGFGEIAPIPWFPVETLEAAAGKLQGLGTTFDPDSMAGWEASMPCTAFALHSAMAPLSVPPRAVPAAALLPAGEPALAALKPCLRAGYTSFKWKIAIHPPEDEMRWAGQLFRELHGRGTLRLDANGGLESEAFAAWCHFLREYPVEFFEQPLPVGQEAASMEIARQAGIPLAFDESACTLEQIQSIGSHYPEARLIVKPSQAGSPERLAQWLAQHSAIRRVYSWAFESAVGLAQVVAMAAMDPHAGSAAGFGGAELMPADGLSAPSGGPLVSPASFSSDYLQQVWEQLPEN